jgi:hypothetical protein
MMPLCYAATTVFDNQAGYWDGGLAACPPSCPATSFGNTRQGCPRAVLGSSCLVRSVASTMHIHVMSGGGAFFISKLY